MNAERRLRIGIAIRDFHLPSRQRIMDGVRAYCLDNPEIEPFCLPVTDGTPLVRGVLTRLDGLIVWASGYDGWVETFWREGLPTVSCNDSFLGTVPTVGGASPVLMAFECLRSLGYRTLGIVSSESSRCSYPAVDVEVIARLEASGLDVRYFDAVRNDPGLHPECMLLEADEPELVEFLSHLPGRSALWCVHDELACLVWRVAARMGIEVPTQLALMGYGNHPCSIQASGGLSSIAIDGVRLGRESARCLHGHLSGLRPLVGGEVFLPNEAHTILTRESSGRTNVWERGIRKAWEMLEDWPPGGVTVDQLVDVAKMSRCAFYQHFEKTFGISPGRALREARINKAKRYLATTDQSVGRIATRCGFSSDSAFSNFVRRVTGETPLELRHRLRAPVDVCRRTAV